MGQKETKVSMLPCISPLNTYLLQTPRLLALEEHLMQACACPLGKPPNVVAEVYLPVAKEWCYCYIGYGKLVTNGKASWQEQLLYFCKCCVAWPSIVLACRHIPCPQNPIHSGAGITGGTISSACSVEKLVAQMHTKCVATVDWPKST